MLRLFQKGENKGENSQYSYSINALLGRKGNNSEQRNSNNMSLTNSSINTQTRIQYADKSV